MLNSSDEHENLKSHQSQGTTMKKSQLFLSILLLIFIPIGLRGQEKKEYGVYEYVVTKVVGTIEQISAGLSDTASKNGWIVLTAFDAGTPKDCPFRAHIIALYHPTYIKALMDANRKTGPFAAIDRINIFTDEQGTHVAVINPHSIVRTVMMDDTAYTALSESHLQSLRQMILSAVHGTPSEKQYGEIRDEGYIGKTMGVMAGGRFEEKIEDEFIVQKANRTEIADKVSRVLADSGNRWGTHLVYRIPLKEYETEIIGIAGTALEGESFDIVGAGSDDSRGDDKCPGLAHAGAYPLELVVAHENDVVSVRMVDAMFRMKMYFEDAGKWAFMKHMSMPGSIKDEIMDRLSPILK